MNLTVYICEKCKKNEVEIYNVLGNYCSECWQEETDPAIPSPRG